MSDKAPFPQANDLGYGTAMEFSLIENFRKLSFEDQLMIYGETLEKSK